MPLRSPCAQPRSLRRLILSVSVVSVLFLLRCLLPFIDLTIPVGTTQKNAGNGFDYNNPLDYDCPLASYWSFRPEHPNSIGYTPTSWITRSEFDRIHYKNAINMSNLEEFIETRMTRHRIQDFVRDLGNLTIDEERNETFSQVKEDKRMVVKKWFPRHVTNGSLIYEPSCGVGLKLYMLAEIMHEEVDPYLTDINVYGNGLNPKDVLRANILWDYAPPSAGGFHKGRFCVGDSFKLSEFVPSNSFDLVYSGRIKPLGDPLDLVLKEDMHHSEVGNYYESWCKGGYREARMLKRIAQNRQHLWFARSITEMIRIAKPGGGIVLDQVSMLRCIRYQAGVSASFFSVNSINKYYWDVDPTSLEVLEVDKGDRNVSLVYMRKNL